MKYRGVKQNSDIWGLWEKTGCMGSIVNLIYQLSSYTWSLFINHYNGMLQGSWAMLRCDHWLRRHLCRLEPSPRMLVQDLCVFIIYNHYRLVSWKRDTPKCQCMYFLYSGIWNIYIYIFLVCRFSLFFLFVYSPLFVEDSQFDEHF